jgi:hypothetical protein
MPEGMIAYTAGALWLLIGLGLGIGLAAYAIYYIFFKLNK